MLEPLQPFQNLLERPEHRPACRAEGEKARRLGDEVEGVAVRGAEAVGEGVEAPEHADDEGGRRKTRKTVFIRSAYGALR